jgi:hypothetical protein
MEIIVNALQIHLAVRWKSRAVERRSHSWQLAADRRGMCVVAGVGRFGANGGCLC